MRTIAILLMLFMATPCWGSSKEILKDGITGFGAGAVGSMVDNPLAAGAAGAGVNIVGGALLDGVLDDKPRHTVVEREVVYVESEPDIVYVEDPDTRYVKRQPRGKAWGRREKEKYRKDHYDKGYRAGYLAGIEAVWREIMPDLRRIQKICKQAINKR